MVLCRFAVGLQVFNAFNRFFNECVKEKLRVRYAGVSAGILNFFHFLELLEAWGTHVVSKVDLWEIIAFLHRNQPPESK